MRWENQVQMKRTQMHKKALTQIHKESFLTRSSNTFSNKKNFLNTPPSFNGDRFELWKARFKFFIQYIELEWWETIIKGSFLPTLQIDGKVVNKLGFLWTIEKIENSKLIPKSRIF